MGHSVFLDTNGWLALLNSGDFQHTEADRIWRELIRQGVGLVLTDWIVAETGNGSSRSRERNRISQAIKKTIEDSRVNLIVVDDALLDRALVYFGQHQDKTWGLVDCASFLVMQDRGITEAFTSDRDFQQAGFTCLLPV
jgi:predicted nucleic acid-binding protein